MSEFSVASELEIKERLDKVELELDEIITRIRNREAGSFNSITGRMPRLMTSLGYSLYKKGRKTSKFNVSDKCIGCGLCEKVCPRKVIDRVDREPIWTEPQCELCLACLHCCPTSAITYGKSAGRGQYVNPRVKW